MSEIFIGRQPIYNRNLDIFAYELMTRESRTSLDESPKQRGDKDSAQVILGAFLDIGIEKLVNDNMAYLRLADHIVRERQLPPLSGDRVILKIPDNVEVDDELIDGVRELYNRGYKLAIDNYHIHTKLKPLAEFSHIIDVNIQQQDINSITEQVNLLRKQHAILLADHVRSYDEYETCRDLGFDYIQGYFLQEPSENINFDFSSF